MSRHYESFVQAFPAVRGEQVESVTRVIGGRDTVRILANADTPDLQEWVAKGPFLLVSPRTAVDFGSQVINLPPVSRKITLVNRGAEDVVVTEMKTTTDTFDFNRNAGGIPLTIRPKQSWNYTWKFFPRAPAGLERAFLQIKSNDAVSTITLELRGRSTEADASTGAEGSSGQGLTLTALGDPDQDSEGSKVGFRIDRGPDHDLPRQLRIKGKDKHVDFAGLAEGSPLARINLRTADGTTLGLTARIESRLSHARWGLTVFPDDPDFAHIPVARGVIGDSGEGFDLELAGSEWLLDHARSRSFHQRTSADFVFQVPVRRPSSGELNFKLFTLPLDPGDGSRSETIVSPR